MVLLNTADNIMAGSSLADRVYQGANLIWERAASIDKQNTFAGIGDGVGITIGNSGSGGTAFDAIVVTAGGAVTAQDSADLAGDGQGMLSSLVANDSATVEWATTSQVEGYLRCYIKTPSSNPAQNTRFMRIEQGTTVIMDARLVAGTQRISINANNTTQSEYVDVSANTIYRVEMGVDSSGLVRLRVYDSSGTPLATTGSGLTGRTAWNKARFGLVSNPQTLSLQMARVGYNASDWCGA